MDQPLPASLAPLQSNQQQFLQDVIKGLSAIQRHLPCKYFYDEQGCALFDEICELEEYYPTRTELEIMRRRTAEMAACLGPQCAIIELGSGSSTKTRILLDHLEDPVAYIPVDIAGHYLQHSADDLRSAYAGLELLPVCADFDAPFEVPLTRRSPRRKIVYFPGSTIGNFEPAAAERLLGRMGQLVGPRGGALVGIDLVKDVAVLEAAYNDRRGVTAAFNLNLLRRINRELDANFKLNQFRHEARYNVRLQRMEMYLISLRSQTVSVAGQRFRFHSGEEICTEYSHKYDLDTFRHYATAAGLALRKYWMDDQQYFSVVYLEVV